MLIFYVLEWCLYSWFCNLLYRNVEWNSHSEHAKCEFVRYSIYPMGGRLPYWSLVCFSGSVVWDFIFGKWREWLFVPFSKECLPEHLMRVTVADCEEEDDDGEIWQQNNAYFLVCINIIHLHIADKLIIWFLFNLSYFQTATLPCSWKVDPTHHYLW